MSPKKARSLNDAFIRNVKKQLVAKQMNQSELSLKMGKERSLISQIVNGHRRVGLRTIEEAAKALRVDPVKLLG